MHRSNFPRQHLLHVHGCTKASPSQHKILEKIISWTLQEYSTMCIPPPPPLPTKSPLAGKRVKMRGQRGWPLQVTDVIIKDTQKPHTCTSTIAMLPHSIITVDCSALATENCQTSSACTFITTIFSAESP